jgi:glycosyltransferase involved in cell wall biosynthesis
MNCERRLGSFTIRWQRGAIRAVKALNPEVIILLGNSGTLTNWIIALWARFKMIKVIMWTCGWEAQRKHSPAYFFKRLLMNFYYLLPHHMLVYSTKARDYMEQIGVTRRRVSICYNGIETDLLAQVEEEVRMSAQQLRASEGVENRTLFLYVGGMLKEKRVDLLLHAFSKLQDPTEYFLWLVGDGPDIGVFRRTSNELRLVNVKFFGRIFAGVDRYFAAADFFVLPGLGGLALNQAMMWGTPCICSDADGTEADLVLDGYTGFRFKPGNAESLADSMTKAAGARTSGSMDEMAESGAALIRDRSNVNRMVSEFQQAMLA